MDDVEWSPRMRSSWTAVRNSCSRRISALTWMRSLPYDHLTGVRIAISLCELGHLQRSDREPLESSREQAIAESQFQQRLHLATRQDLEAEEQQREARLSCQGMCAVLDDQ
jgi:hypothetical protein